MILPAISNRIIIQFIGVIKFKWFESHRKSVEVKKRVVVCLRPSSDYIQACKSFTQAPCFCRNMLPRSWHLDSQATTLTEQVDKLTFLFLFSQVRQHSLQFLPDWPQRRGRHGCLSWDQITWHVCDKDRPVRHPSHSKGPAWASSTVRKDFLNNLERRLCVL